MRKICFKEKMKFDILPEEILYHIFGWAYYHHPSFQFCRAVGRPIPRVISDYPLMVVSHQMLQEYQAEHESNQRVLFF